MAHSFRRQASYSAFIFVSLPLIFYVTCFSLFFFLKSYFRYSATDALKFVGIERDVDFALR